MISGAKEVYATSLRAGILPGACQRSRAIQPAPNYADEREDNGREAPRFERSRPGACQSSVFPTQNCGCFSPGLVRMMLPATQRFCRTHSCRACLSRWPLLGDAFLGRPHDCHCEVAWDPRSNHSVWGYRRFALHSCPWHYLFRLRSSLYSVNIVVSKGPNRLTGDQMPVTASTDQAHFKSASQRALAVFVLSEFPLFIVGEHKTQQPGAYAPGCIQS